MKEIFRASLLLALTLTASSAFSYDILSELSLRPEIRKSYPKSLARYDRYEPNIYLINIHLGKLSKSQFLKLKEYFKNQSSIMYSENQEYKLEDFFPPAMEALLNKKVLNYEYDIEDLRESKIFWPAEFDKESLFVGANCHGTSLEMSHVIRTQEGKGAYTLYAPIGREVNQMIANRKIFSPIQYNDLKFGDIVAFVNEQPEEDDPENLRHVQHTAIYITKNIFFEKRDLADEQPIRLVFLEDMQNRLKTALDAKIKTEFYRITGDKNALAFSNNWKTSKYWNRYGKNGLEKKEIAATAKGLNAHFDSMHIGVNEYTGTNADSLDLRDEVYVLSAGEKIYINESSADKKPVVIEQNKSKRISHFAK